MGSDDDSSGSASPTVFISYAHDNEAHKALVLEFATLLRTAGFDVRLDLWCDDGRQDWSLWATRRLADDDFVLVIASPEYKRRAEGSAPPEEGRGVGWEAGMIRNHLYRDPQKELRRYLPVVLPGRSIDEIPTFLIPYSGSHYRVSKLTVDGIGSLLRTLHGIPSHPIPELGTFTGLPPALDQLQPQPVPQRPKSVSSTAEQLAEAVGAQWRSEAVLRGAEDAYMLQVSWQSADGCRGTSDEIVDFYDKLKSGRLVVLGEPGAGKTILAIRFLLAKLECRNAGDRVPVLFNVGAWDPAISIGDWLVDQLVHDHPELASRGSAGPNLAARLVYNDQILPILDGLDEIAEGMHYSAIKALNAAGKMPFLLTSRVREYEIASDQSPRHLNAAAVRLDPLTVDDVQSYLSATTHRKIDNGDPLWKPVFDELNANDRNPAADNLAAALSTPLMAGLTRSIYGENHGQNPNELLHSDKFDTQTDIEEYLLASFIQALYPEYAQRWLGFLAQHLNRLQTRDLEWWRLCNAVSRPARGLLSGLATSLTILLSGLLLGLNPIVAALVFGGAVGLAIGTEYKTIYGLIAGVLCGLAFDFLDMPSFDYISGLVFAPICFFAVYRLAGNKEPLPSRTQLRRRGMMLQQNSMTGFAEWVERFVFRVFLLWSVIFTTAGLAAILLDSGLEPRLIEPLGLLALGIVLSQIVSLTRRTNPVRWQDLPCFERTTFALMGGAFGGLSCFLVPGRFTAEIMIIIARIVILWMTIMSISGLLAHWAKVRFRIEIAVDIRVVASFSELLQYDRRNAIFQSFTFPFAVGVLFFLRARTIVPTPIYETIVFEIAVGLVILLSRKAWGHWLVIVRFWLPVTGRLPWRLKSFLGDAHKRQVLRQVGAVYQFRHARLQEHLARGYRKGADPVAS